MDTETKYKIYARELVRGLMRYSPHILDKARVAEIMVAEHGLTAERAGNLIDAAIDFLTIDGKIGDKPPHGHLLTCVICERSTYPRHQYACHWAVCSAECHQEFRRRVDAIVEKRHPGLLDRESMVIDPYVGDESAIAKLSARSRMGDDMTGPLRYRIARFYAELYDLDVHPGHLLILAECSPGSNTETVVIEGVAYTVFEGGVISLCRYNNGERVPPEDLSYYYERVAGGWQQHRADEYPCKFLRDADMKSPQYGDAEGTTLSFVEHGLEALW